MPSEKGTATPNQAPLEKDLLGQNSAVNPRSRIIGGSIQDLPEETQADIENGGESFKYVNPETESYDTEDGHRPSGSKHFKSTGAGERYGGPTLDPQPPEPQDDRRDYTGTNGETRREVNRRAVEGTPPTPDQAKGIPPPVK
jgi:hypothetical protein